MTAALLAVTGGLVSVAAALFAVSFLRRHPGPALAGLTVMIVAAFPAVVYGSLAS